MNDKVDMTEQLRGLISEGPFKRGIQNTEFRSKKNFHYLWKNINSILSQTYNHPIVVDQKVLEGVIWNYSYMYDPQSTSYLNKRVIQKLLNMFRDDQHDIIIANEWEDEQFEVLSRNTDTLYNPIAVPVRTEEAHPIVYVEM